MRPLNVYRVHARNTLAVQFQYRIAMLIWLLSGVVPPVVYLVVWETVARTNGGSVAGFSTHAFAAYYIVLMLVDHVTYTWVIFVLGSDVQQGVLSPRLLRPAHPIYREIAENTTYKLLMAPALLLAAGAMTLAFRPALHPAPWAVALAIPALLGAAAMRFMVEWTVSLLGFWTTRMTAIDQTWGALVLFFSGQVAPLALLPGPARALADILPFRWMVSFPVELLLGRISLRGTIMGIGWEVMWFLVALLVARILWRAGLRHHGAVGG